MLNAAAHVGRRGWTKFLAIALFGFMIASDAEARLAAAPFSSETLLYAITRNGEPIGTQRMVISRSGDETTVKVTTALAVKVLFVTAYRFDHKESERWIGGHLVALTSTTDNNGIIHDLSVAGGTVGLKINADGRVSRSTDNVATASLWSPALLRRKALLDTQDGQIDPLSVRDLGMEAIVANDHRINAHHYMIHSRYSEDIWYDQRGRLVRLQLIARDNSLILYTLM